MSTYTHRRERGFTLIEMMTALSIFAIVITIALGAVLSIFDSNRKTQAESSVMNNLNLAVESMSREMRFGTNYHCGDSGTLTDPQNCATDGDNFISFLSSDGKQMVYRKNGNAIERSSDGGFTYVAVTAPELVVENLSFYVVGAGGPSLNSLQPRVLIELKGYAGTKASTRTDFSLQTLVSERKLDNGL